MLHLTSVMTLPLPWMMSINQHCRCENSTKLYNPMILRAQEFSVFLYHSVSKDAGLFVLWISSVLLVSSLTLPVLQVALQQYLKENWITHSRASQSPLYRHFKCQNTGQKHSHNQCFWTKGAEIESARSCVHDWDSMPSCKAAHFSSCRAWYSSYLKNRQPTS